MDGQLTLLRKRLRARNPCAQSSELTPLPTEAGLEPASSSRSPRGSSAPASFGIAPSPTKAFAIAGAARQERPRSGTQSETRNRLQPRRVGEPSPDSKRVAPTRNIPPRAASLQPAGYDDGTESRPGSSASSRPPLPKRSASTSVRAGPRHRSATSACMRANVATAAAAPPPPPQRPLAKVDAGAVAAAVKVEADLSPAQSRAAAMPAYWDCCNRKFPLSVLSTILSFMPVVLLPAFRRVCLCCFRVCTARLSRDPSLRSAVDFHLEGRKLKSKRVWVIARARPMTDNGISCIHIDRNKVTVANGGGGQGAAGSSFFFDRAYPGTATQAEVCDYIGEKVLPHALNGEHICLLAYGQTGSGKTHTMFGSLEAGANQGVAFRAVNQLAELMRVRSSAGAALPTIEFSFLEVYNDELYDLLDSQKKLSKQRSSEKHVVPQGLTRRTCSADRMEEQVHNWLREGAATRTVGKTVFNPRSSRSHGVVLLHICWGFDGQGSRLQPSREKSGTRGQTRIYIVDLAGSERAGMYAIDKEQLKEGEQINLSLSALGRVVSALAGGKCEHVPYRDSALTWLLKDAITGTSARVCMIAAVHPAHPVETASTLRYARQYSCLQASTDTRIPVLTSEVREQMRRVDVLKRAFETALSGDEYGIPWTMESLEGTVQPTRNAREVIEAHSGLAWTPAHQSKSLVRGQRRDRSGIGKISRTLDVAPPRAASDAPDGRPNDHSPTRSPVPSGDEKVVEVVFEGRHGRPPVVLWYPESALEVVQPPKKLLDTMQQLKLAEEELLRKKAELVSAKESSTKNEQDWMSKE